MEDQSTLGIIPARGGSKGIPRKNIKALLEKPLISYTINASCSAEHIDHTIVTTDDEEIASIATSYGASVPFIRPKSLAQDKTPTEPVVEHTLENIDESFETFALLQPTSPLRNKSHIDEAIEKFYTSDAASLVSVFEEHSYRWKKTDNGAIQINYDEERKRRQEKSSEFIENGAIYMTKVEDFRKTQSFTAGKTILYEMDELYSIDVDEPIDLRLAELVLQAKNQ